MGNAEKPLLLINGSRQQGGYVEELSHFFWHLSGDFRLGFTKKLYDHLLELGAELPAGSVRLRDSQEMSRYGEPKLAVSIGGDGTVLRTVEWLGSGQVPIFAINTGHLGFLTTCGVDEAPENLAEEILAGRFICTRRVMVELNAPEIPKDFWPYALNEVALMRNDASAMLQMEVWVDGHFLGDYPADGLVIATPTGSTGYNLSLGGPILQPDMDSLVLSPIAPHLLTLRPLVLSGKSNIRVRVSTRGGSFRVSLDGRSFPLPSATEIGVSQAPFQVLLLSHAKESFADSLREKLHWAQR